MIELVKYTDEEAITKIKAIFEGKKPLYFEVIDHDPGSYGVFNGNGDLLESGVASEWADRLSMGEFLT